MEITLTKMDVVDAGTLALQLRADYPNAKIFYIDEHGDRFHFRDGGWVEIAR